MREWRLSEENRRNEVVLQVQETWVEPSENSLSLRTKSKRTPRKFNLFCGSFFVSTYMLYTYKKSYLEKEIDWFIRKYPKIISFCFGKKRPIFLSKYLVANSTRPDGTRRLQLFYEAIDRIKCTHLTEIHRHSENEFEILGITKLGKEYAIHIREEILRKDRRLYLISTFEK